MEVTNRLKGLDLIDRVPESLNEKGNEGMNKGTETEECKEYNQSAFGVGHLVMSICRVFSCVFGRGWREVPELVTGKPEMCPYVTHG